MRSIDQGMSSELAYPEPKWGVDGGLVADRHPSGAYHGGSSTAMGGASLDLVDYPLGIPVLLEYFFGLWRPPCPPGLKLVLFWPVARNTK